MTQIVHWLNTIVHWLNVAANALGQALTFVGVMPGWLSATIIAIVSGMAMIVGFKWTSNQTAIKRARQDIRASLLTVKLFHDNMPAGFRAQGRVLWGAVRLLVYAIVPILAMFVPVTLLLGQMALWYQARPLHVGEDTVIVARFLSNPSGSGEPAPGQSLPLPTVTLEATSAVEDIYGPVRVEKQHEVCWSVRARENGLHRLIFHVDGESVEKELAVGDGFMPVSLKRPTADWSDAVWHPREQAFEAGSRVQSIEIAYPKRDSWTSGTDQWAIYWFVLALIVGFLSRGIFKVNL
jgi:hypothetical protein